MEKSVSYFLILNLLFSIIAFSPTISSASETYKNYVDDGGTLSEEAWKKYIQNKGSNTNAQNTENLDTSETQPTPSATGTPAGFSDHGYAGQAGEFIFGAENVAPKGWSFVDGKWKYTGQGASGFGYSVTGILQGAM